MVFTVIHIGKCGGSTVRESLIRNEIKFKKIHVRKDTPPKFSCQKKYLIVIRNPIQRFISAYNWRYHLVFTTEEQEGQEGEKNIFLEYKTVNDFVTALRGNIISIEDAYKIRHIDKNIHFYLQGMFDNIQKKNILGVVCTETLDNDMEKFFSINITIKEKDNKKYSKELSGSNYKYLKNVFLIKDYECIDKLYENDIIDDEKYDILSK